jgi:hypothetical protein
MTSGEKRVSSDLKPDTSEWQMVSGFRCQGVIRSDKGGNF